jgi:hypothetical protein
MSIKKLVAIAAVLCAALAVLQALSGPMQLPAHVGTGFSADTTRFQLTLSMDERRAILDYWTSSGALRMVAALWFVVDALFLVPAYFLLLKAWAAAAARHRCGAGWWLAVPAWATVTAAVADEMENAGSLLLVCFAHLLSPLSHWSLTVVTGLKWSALALAVAVLCVAGVRHAGWAGLLAAAGRALRWLAHAGVTAVRLAWLNIFAVTAFVVGVGLVAAVPQVHNILSSLGLETEGDAVAIAQRVSNLSWFMAGVALWGLSIWYSLRAMSGLFARRLKPGAVRDWILRDMPRVAAYGAVVLVATLGTIHMSGRNGAMMAAFMCVGALIMYEALTPLLGVAVGKAGWWRPGYVYRRARYRRSVTAVSAVAFLFGANGMLDALLRGWYTNPAGLRWSAERWSAGEPAMIAAFFTALLAWALVVRFPMRMALRVTALGAGVAVWWAAAAAANAASATWVFGLLLLLATGGLWLVAERRHIDWARVPFVPAWTRARVWGLLAATGIALVVLFSFAPLRVGLHVGTLGIGFTALAMWALVFTLVWIYLPQRAGLGNWALVPVVWLVLFAQPAGRSVPVGNVDRQPAVGTPYLSAHFKSWNEGQSPDAPVFLVAAAGGGLRAAYWTASLLAEMDDRTCGEFGNRVFAVSGVSGGSVGLAAYLAQREVWQAKPKPARCEQGRAAQVQAFLRRDYLGPVAGSMLFAELPQAFVPVTYLRHERGRSLSDGLATGWEATFEDAGHKALLRKPFLELFDVSRPGPHPRPAIFLNATRVETGRRAIMSNVSLGSMVSDSVFRQGAVSRDVHLHTADMSVVEAAVNSARFPLISPPGPILGCAPQLPLAAGKEDACRNAGYGIWGHLVDGGYFENGGVETLLDAWPMVSRNPTQRMELGKNVYLIVITNDKQPPAVACPRNPVRLDPQTMTMQGRRDAPPLAGLFDDLNGRSAWDGAAVPAQGSDAAAPVAALLNIRSARSDLALARAREQFGCPGMIEWHLSQGLQCQQRSGNPSVRPDPDGKGDPPLGWVLSKSAVGGMNYGALEFSRQLAEPDKAACIARGPLLPGPPARSTQAAQPK